MNRARRSILRKIIKTLSGLESQTNDDAMLDELRQMADSIEQVRDEEQDCLDNMPDNLQWSKRADAYGDNIDDLSDAWTDMLAIIEVYEQHNGHDNPYREAKTDILSVISYCTGVIER